MCVIGLSDRNYASTILFHLLFFADQRALSKFVDILCPVGLFFSYASFARSWFNCNILIVHLTCIFLIISPAISSRFFFSYFAPRTPEGVSCRCCQDLQTNLTTYGTQLFRINPLPMVHTNSSNSLLPERIIIVAVDDYNCSFYAVNTGTAEGSVLTSTLLLHHISNILKKVSLLILFRVNADDDYPLYLVSFGASKTLYLEVFLFMKHSSKTYQTYMATTAWKQLKLIFPLPLWLTKKKLAHDAVAFKTNIKKINDHDLRGATCNFIMLSHKNQHNDQFHKNQVPVL